MCPDVVVHACRPVFGILIQSQAGLQSESLPQRLNLSACVLNVRVSYLRKGIE